MQGDTARPLVSIITPTYNHEAWIGACIESAQRQSYPHWEQIIIDDGSTDATADAVAPYLSDPRIRYIRQPNKGIWHLAENYNTALRASRGEFVALLEGDDFWPDDKLAAQLPAFADTSIGMAYGRILITDDHGQVQPEATRRKQEWQPPYASFASPSPLPFLRDLLLLRGDVGAISVMFRRAALDDVGGFYQPQGFPAVDFTTVLRVASRWRVAFVDHPIGVWRQHAGQTTDIHGLQYALGHSRAAVAHFQQLPASARHELAIGERDIWNARRNYLANAFWSATQACMRTGKWPNARQYALGTMRWGNFFRKAEGVAAFAASLAHIDLDRVIRQLASTPLGRKLVQ